MVDPKLCVVNANKTIAIPCTVCGAVIDTGVSEEVAAQYFAGTGLIQNIMPHVSKDIREMFISGTCTTCFNHMFPSCLTEMFPWEDE